MTAEIARGQRGTSAFLTASHASMRPRSNDRGNEREEGSVADQRSGVTASMRPRSNDRGNTLAVEDDDVAI